MKATPALAFSIAVIVSLLALVNALFSAEAITPSLQRAEVISGLSSICLFLLGFLILNTTPGKIDEFPLKGEQGFYLSSQFEGDLKRELAWGSHMILTASATSTILIYFENQIILRRGIISKDDFLPGNICLSSTKKSKYISLVSTKFYPGKKEFDPVLKNLPSLIVFPIIDKGWLIVGGCSERCFTKSDEIWIEGWTNKLSEML